MRVLVSLALLSALALGATEGSRTVLAVYSDERPTPASKAMDTALRDSLGAETDNAPIYLSEFLDVSRFGSSAYDKLLSDFFRNKYAGQSLDVVVAVGPLAFQFLRRHQADLFTGIPVVFCGVGSESLQGQTLPANFVGVPIEVEPLQTIEPALSLQPDAREIVIVTGASEFDHMEATLRSDLPHLQSSVPNRTSIRFPSGLLAIVTGATTLAAMFSYRLSSLRIKLQDGQIDAENSRQRRIRKMVETVGLNSRPESNRD